MKTRPFILAISILALLLFAAGCGGGEEEAAPPAKQAEAPQPSEDLSLFTNPIPILEPVGGLENLEEGQHQLLGKASKKWNVCVSFPTMKDPYWLAADYGAVTQAKRLGINLRILDAGGYDKLSKQISDLEDCVASGADAVLVAAISGEGVEAKVNSIVGQGIPVIESINRIASPKVTARSTLDFKRMGVTTGEYLRGQVGGEKVKVAFFPGPEGAGWANRAFEGFKEATAGANIEVVAVKWGDTGKDVQLNLVEDTLQAYPDLDWIIGNAVAADAAVGALAEAQRTEAKIASFYQTDLVHDWLEKGKINFAANDNVVWMAAMAVDLAVRVLEGENIRGKELWPKPGVLTPETVKAEELSAGFAPEGFSPVFSVGG